MNIINLTPHEVNIVLENGAISIPTSGTVARVAAKTEKTGDINGIPVTETVFGDVEGLPEPQDGTVFIVSTLVAQRVHNRSDVFVPSEPVRDSAGKIIGCKSLGRV